jgi:hypothetical protein
VNTNLQNAIKNLAASRAVLSDARRVDEALPVFAGKEAAAERKAFIQCLASGLPAELQKCPDQEARAGCKNLAARKMAAGGVAAPLAKEIVDLVDFLVPANAAPDVRPARTESPAPPRPASPSNLRTEQPDLPRPLPAVPGQNTGTSGGAKNSLSKKTLVFGLAGGLGAAIGSLLTEPFQQPAVSFIEAILHVALWAVFISLGVSVGLLLAQSIYLKKPPRSKSLVKTVILGIVSGTLAGAAAEVIFFFTADISTAVEIISRVICWGLIACGVGFCASLFVPNYPRPRAMLAGFLGGAAGGAIFRATFDLLPAVAGRIVGTAVSGLFIGLAISIVEEILREAWITVVWARNETTNVSLGAKPLVLGSSPEADVYLRRDKFPPVAAIVKIENSRVVVDDKLTGRSAEQADGSEVSLGTIRIIIHVKK